MNCFMPIGWMCIKTAQTAGLYKFCLFVVVAVAVAVFISRYLTLTVMLS